MTGICKKITKKTRTISVLVLRAIDGARTRGLDLGKVARYQLRHYRMLCFVSEVFPSSTKHMISYRIVVVKCFFEIFKKIF